MNRSYFDRLSTNGSRHTSTDFFRMNWSVYIILCTDNTLYTGIAINVSRRFNQHADGRGAKYFRGHQPKQLVYIEPGHNRSSATKREIDLKKLSREEKSRLIASTMNKITDLLL